MRKAGHALVLLALLALTLPLRCAADEQAGEAAQEEPAPPPIPEQKPFPAPDLARNFVSVARRIASRPTYSTYWWQLGVLLEGTHDLDNARKAFITARRLAGGTAGTPLYKRPDFPDRDLLPEITFTRFPEEDLTEDSYKGVEDKMPQYPLTTVICREHQNMTQPTANNMFGLPEYMYPTRSCYIENLYIHPQTGIFFVVAPDQRNNTFPDPLVRLCTLADSRGPEPHMWGPPQMRWVTPETDVATEEVEGLHTLIGRFNHANHGHMVIDAAMAAFWIMSDFQAVTTDLRVAWTDGWGHHKLEDRLELITTKPALTHDEPLCSPNKICILKNVLIGIGGKGFSFHLDHNTKRIRERIYLRFREHALHMMPSIVPKPGEEDYESVEDEITISLVKRVNTERMILNNDEIVAYMRAKYSTGALPVKVHVRDVVFDAFPTLAQQLREVYKTDILIGIDGTALDNTYFMRNGTGVVNIWPEWGALHQVRLYCQSGFVDYYDVRNPDNWPCTPMENPKNPGCNVAIADLEQAVERQLEKMYARRHGPFAKLDPSTWG